MSARPEPRWEWHPHACGCAICDPARAHADARFDRTASIVVAAAFAYFAARVAATLLGA